MENGIQIDPSVVSMFRKNKEFTRILKQGLKGLSDKDNLSLLEELGSEYFNRYTAPMLELLNNPAIGYAILAPVSIDADTKLQPVENYFVHLAIMSNIFSASLDSENQTPFTMYIASESMSQQLASIGMENFAPDTDLPFHSDIHEVDGGFEFPNYLALENLYLDYENPGSLRWLPTALWGGLDDFISKVGLEKKYDFLVPSSVYGKGISSFSDVKKVTVESPFFMNSGGVPALFLNGTFSPRDESEDTIESALADVKKSVLTFKEYIRIPQRAGQMVIFNNCLGLHAREPMQGSCSTDPDKPARVFLRTLSREGFSLGAVRT